METLPRPDFESKGPRPCFTVEDLSIFFGEADMPRTNVAAKKTEQAKKVCATCPYKIECGAYAIDHPDERGVWGGLSEAERKMIRERMSAAS